MTSTVRIATALGAFLMVAAALAAQAPPTDPDAGDQPAAQEEKKAPEPGRPISMQYYRPLDQRGVNMFETTKDPGVEYTGFKLDFGAAFTSQAW